MNAFNEMNVQCSDINLPQPWMMTVLCEFGWLFEFFNFMIVCVCLHEMIGLPWVVMICHDFPESHLCVIFFCDTVSDIVAQAHQL